MELEAILDWYDCDQRRDAKNHGARREVSGTVVRHVSLHEPHSHITCSRLTADSADSAIEEQIQYFARLGHSFEWAVFSHDAPADLKERLLRKGFEPEETETIVVLELGSMNPSLLQPSAHDVRRISDVTGLDEVMAVTNAVWGSNDRPIGPRLRREMQETPDRLSVYAAYCDGVPACSGWVRFDPASPFASLWGGSTRPEFRKRGFYTALVAARAREARDRGARFLTVDAQAMSRPILEKLGFRVLTQATPMIWRPR